MILVPKKTKQKLDEDQPPIAGRNHSRNAIQNTLMVSGHRVNKSRITLPPVSMWLKIKEETEC